MSASTMLRPDGRALEKHHLGRNRVADVGDSPWDRPWIMLLAAGGLSIMFS